MKQVCIGRDGQMLVICPAHPMYSCGDCPSADNSLCLSLRPWAKRKTWNVVCLNAFPLVAPKPHSRQPSPECSPFRSGNWRSEPSGRVCPNTFRLVFAGLSSRQAAAMSFSEARPQSMRWQKRTAPTTKPSAMR